jgi:signal transduction histidine kinase
MKKSKILILAFIIIGLAIITLTIVYALYSIHGDDRYEGMSGGILISIVLTILNILLFVYALAHCSWRSRANFMTLSELVMKIGRISMKNIWICILLLAFILSCAFRLQICSNSYTVTIPPDGVIAMTQQYQTPFFFYEMQRTGNQESRRRNVWIPNPLFFIIVYLYYRGVKKRPKVEIKNEE